MGLMPSKNEISLLRPAINEWRPNNLNEIQLLSLWDNAPNFLVGCVIKKRLYIPDVAHAEIVRFKGSFVEIDGLILVFRL